MHFDITKANIGNTDRVIRIILGALLILSVLRGSSWVGGVIGAALLATAYFRFCPAYTIVDFSSNKDVVPTGK